MGQTYSIGTRTSPLALKQVEEVISALRKFYPYFKAEIVGIDTYGDRDKDTPISQVEGSDFFTLEIDKTLLAGEIDFAVHSAKDLPDDLKEGLIIAVLTESIDPYDVLVSKSGLKLDELPYGAKIGTSSLRRKTQLKKYRPDFQIVDIRGNIEDRLRLLDDNEIRNMNDERLSAEANLPPTHATAKAERSSDAIVIAAAGLIRLRLEGRTTQRIPFEIIKPHPLQGVLAIVARDDNLQLLDLLSVIDSRETVLS